MGGDEQMGTTPCQGGKKASQAGEDEGIQVSGDEQLETTPCQRGNNESQAEEEEGIKVEVNGLNSSQGTYNMKTSLIFSPW